MCLGLEFQRNKVNRLIQQKGIELVFLRSSKNEFGESIKDQSEEIRIKGFYHETSSYVIRVASDDTASRSKPQPLIMCSIEDGKKIAKDDLLNYNGNKYTVTGLTNLNELDICYDISLEVIHDG